MSAVFVFVGFCFHVSICRAFYPIPPILHLFVFCIMQFSLNHRNFNFFVWVLSCIHKRHIRVGYLITFNILFRISFHNISAYDIHLFHYLFESRIYWRKITADSELYHQSWNYLVQQLKKLYNKTTFFYLICLPRSMKSEIWTVTPKRPVYLSSNLLV